MNETTIFRINEIIKETAKLIKKIKFNILLTFLDSGFLITFVTINAATQSNTGKIKKEHIKTTICLT